MIGRWSCRDSLRIIVGDVFKFNFFVLTTEREKKMFVIRSFRVFFSFRKIFSEEKTRLSEIESYFPLRFCLLPRIDETLQTDRIFLSQTFSISMKNL